MTVTDTAPNDLRAGGTALNLVVADRRVVSRGVVELTLRDPFGEALPPWRPGAHIDLALRDDLVRQFSLCGPLGDPTRYRIAVLREPGGRGGSAYCHDSLSVGDVVTVRGPRNHFALVPASRYVFLAGGIGITPILPMVVAADAVGADWTLLYVGRSRSSMAFLDELARYGERVDVWATDERGRCPLGGILGNPVGAVYCCGPERMLAEVELLSAGWAADLHVERFVAKPLDETVVDEAFEVVLQQSGKTLVVPADASVLETVENAGVPVLSSCREGTCGTCETTVLAGVPEHRDCVLAPAERAANDVMMICVSRSCGGRLVLDL